MPPHPLTNFEIKKHFQNELKFNSVFSRNNLSKINKKYIKNLDEYESIGTHWIPLYVNGNNITYFDIVEIEDIPKEIKKLIGNKNITTNFIEYKHTIQ